MGERFDGQGPIFERGPRFERIQVPGVRRIPEGPRVIVTGINCVSCPLAKPDACAFGAGARQVIAGPGTLLEKETAIDYIAGNKDRAKDCPAETIIVEALKLPFQQEPFSPSYESRN